MGFELAPGTLATGSVAQGAAAAWGASYAPTQSKSHLNKHPGDSELC